MEVAPECWVLSLGEGAAHDNAAETNPIITISEFLQGMRLKITSAEPSS
jgi:hypothetical protein